MTDEIAIIAMNLTGPAKRFMLWVTGSKRVDGKAVAWIDHGESEECLNYGLVTRTATDAYATERGDEVGRYLRQIGFK